MSGFPDLSKSTKLDLATDNGTRATRRKLSPISRSFSSDQFLVDMERAEVGGMVDIVSCSIGRSGCHVEDRQELHNALVTESTDAGLA